MAKVDMDEGGLGVADASDVCEGAVDVALDGGGDSAEDGEEDGEADGEADGDASWDGEADGDDDEETADWACLMCSLNMAQVVSMAEGG